MNTTSKPSKHDYTALDAAILRRIVEVAPASFQSVYAFTGGEANKLAAADFEKAEGWRIVDRRLQALRNAGKIKYQRKPEGWVIA